MGIHNIAACQFERGATSTTQQSSAAEKAQDSCPMQIGKYYMFGPQPYVKLTNSTQDKTIKAFALGLVLYDAAEIPRNADTLLERNKMKLKPAESTTARWEGGLHHDDYTEGGIKLYIDKVVFDDGTSWQDDGSHSCFAGHK